MTKRSNATVRLLAAACVLSFSGVSFGQGACEVAKLTASNGQSGDRFGNAFSIDAATAIVGRSSGGGGPGEERAWIFQRDPDTGDWHEVAVLVDPDSQPGGGFGEVVAISGDFAIVGANNAGHDCPTNCTGPGAAYIFSRDQGGIDNWGLLVEIEPPDPVCGCSIGRSVSIDGDTAIVSAGGLGLVQGEIYVFQQDERGPNNWGLVTSFAPPEPFTTNGWAIAIDGDTAAIRINGDLVYLFERDQGGVNNWGTVGFAVAPFTASGGGAQGRIALEANTLVVGAWKNPEHGLEAGAAYVYYRDYGGSNNWGQVANLFSSQPAETDQFGWCVAIAGDFVAVGARGLQPGGGPLMGSVHVFQRHAGGQDNWGQIAYVNGGSDTEPDDGIGRMVGLQEDTLLVAAMHDIGQAGSVYVFEIGGPDCNSNILCDPIEIANGTSDDTDGNGVPDECQCWDCGGDNNDNVGIVDFLALLAQWGQVGLSCDFDGDGVGITDFLTLLANWGPCP